jgi:hypothetical protein
MGLERPRDMRKKRLAKPSALPLRCLYKQQKQVFANVGPCRTGNEALRPFVAATRGAKPSP